MHKSMGKHDSSFILVRVRVFLDGTFRGRVGLFTFIFSNAPICNYFSGTIEGPLHSYSSAVCVYSAAVIHY